MKNFKIGLASKLVIYLSFSLIVIFSIIGVFNLRIHKRHMMMGVYQNAAQVSDIIKYSTNYSMMTNERDGIYRIVNTIAREPGIEKIRIYNKEGKITFSTEEAEVNSMVDMHEDACNVCHSDGSTPPTGDISILKRTRDYLDQDGRHVLGLISPIKSESSCVTADCHAHSADQKVLGVLDVIMQLDKIDASQIEYERYFHWYMFLTIFVVCVTSMLYVFFMVHRPVRKIVEGTKKIAEGKLSFMIDIDSKDEIGSLAESFNHMTVDLKKFRNDLLAAKAYTENIIHSMLNSLIVVDQNGAIRNVNKATCDLLGYSEDELINKPMSFVFAKGYFEELGFSDSSLHDFGGTGETIYQSKDGKKIRVLFSASCIFNDQSEIQGVVFMAQDITVQTEAMRAGHMSSLGELAAGVAHEINNPLNSIINFAQILIDELQSDAELTDELLYRIINEGDRVSNIVRSLLSFARKSEEGKTMVNIHEVIQETFALLDTQILKDGINLEIKVSEGLPQIYGNFQQIMQVFINLTNNSRYALNQKFSGVSPKKRLAISAELKKVEDEVVIDVVFHDEGTGISAQIIDKVVNPFFTTKPAGEGTGLGLAISHGIVTDHDGRLIIESIEGEYTRVTTRFPVVEPDDILDDS
ncbi:PAS domain-containing sensor histidine kinase [Thermodesulfobacteriota bacterium]